jgi:hypothetical protein
MFVIIHPLCVCLEETYGRFFRSPCIGMLPEKLVLLNSVWRNCSSSFTAYLLRPPDNEPLIRQFLIKILVIVIPFKDLEKGLPSSHLFSAAFAKLVRQLAALSPQLWGRRFLNLVVSRFYCACVNDLHSCFIYKVWLQPTRLSFTVRIPLNPIIFSSYSTS